jgi:hypothetical protein
MGYVKITLGLGISLNEKESKEVEVKLLEMIKSSGWLEEEGELSYFEETIEDYGDFGLSYGWAEYLHDKFGLSFNYGYYHSEMTIVFETSHIDDSDIRTMQNFNFSFTKSDIDELKLTDKSKKLLDELGIKEEDLEYKVMVYNY